MNTSAWHYQQAESYLAGAAELRRQGLDERARLLVAVAQVHAELASVEFGYDLDYVNTSDIEVRRELDLLVAGSGPEECVANDASNPNWLRNHARNALAIARELEAVP